jgi:hydroxymethylbilane synthase
MLNKTLRIATRKSPLALWQANHIREELLKYWPTLDIELIPMTTSGDRFLKDKLLAVGGKGLFVKELEDALLEHRADLAVHSMKDVPANQPNGLSLASICKRDNPFDALLSLTYNTLDELPKGAKVGTSSLRRQSQLLAVRPDLCVISLRGNIQTRIQKLQSGEFDAIILAAAGLERMNLQHLIKEIINDDCMMPACGQGALGIECRTHDKEINALIAPLNDIETALCVSSERYVNALLGGNCHVPLAVFCQTTLDSQITIRARVGKIDGSLLLNSHQHGVKENALTMAKWCAEDLLNQGARELLHE